MELFDRICPRHFGDQRQNTKIKSRNVKSTKRKLIKDIQKQRFEPTPA
jgi:hypothetical protein